MNTSAAVIAQSPRAALGDDSDSHRTRERQSLEPAASPGKSRSRGPIAQLSTDAHRSEAEALALDGQG